MLNPLAPSDIGIVDIEEKQILPAFHFAVPCLACLSQAKYDYLQTGKTKHFIQESVSRYLHAFLYINYVLVQLFVS